MRIQYKPHALCICTHVVFFSSSAWEWTRLFGWHIKVIGLRLLFLLSQDRKSLSLMLRRCFWSRPFSLSGCSCALRRLWGKSTPAVATESTLTHHLWHTIKMYLLLLLCSRSNKNNLGMLHSKQTTANWDRNLCWQTYQMEEIKVNWIVLYCFK